MKRRAFHRTCTGFTLTEILVAMVVLSIGLLGITAMTISAIKTLTFSKELTMATTLAQDKMEAIQRVAFSAITSQNYPVEDYGTISDFPQFRRTVAISPGPTPTTKMLLITVSWRRKAAGQPHTVTLQTLVSP